MRVDSWLVREPSISVGQDTIAPLKKWERERTEIFVISYVAKDQF